MLFIIFSVILLNYDVKSGIMEWINKVKYGIYIIFFVGCVNW